MNLKQRLTAAALAAGFAGSSWGQVAVPVDSGGAIGDASTSPTTTVFNFTVTTPGNITDIHVQLAIEHDDVFDIYAQLYSPDGWYVDLFQGLVSQTPPKYTQIQDTIIDDDAVAGPIGTDGLGNDTGNAESAAPWNGTFQPQFFGTGPHSDLSEFNGKAAAGTWELRIIDNVSGDTGTLFAPGETASWGTTTGTQLLITVPEPSEYVALAGLGLLGFALLRRRRLLR